VLNDHDGALAGHLAAVMRLDSSAPAVEFGGTWIPWGRLASAVDGILAVLDRAGVPAGGEVGLLVRNRPAHVATLLATLTSRRCLVSFNAVEGDLLLAEDLRRRQPSVVIASGDDWERPGVLAAARDVGAAVVALDAGMVPVVLSADERRGDPARSRPGVAVEMLTSGTTGRPKRVDIHAAKIWTALVAARSLEAHAAGPPVPELRSSVSLVHSPIVHTSGLWRLLETLTAGRRIALLERFSVDGFVDLVRRHRPKSVSLVPAALQMVLDADVDPEDLASLRAVVSGTAPLAPETAEEFERRYGIPVLGAYGATEFAGAIAAWSLPDKRRWGAAKRGSVGRILPGLSVRIVDEVTGAEVAVGERGVLEARGTQLLQPGWTRTTDLASIDADGFLYLHGRSDSAINRGGFKVHPEAIEEVLESHDRIAGACVIGMSHAHLGQVPVAVVELVDNGARPEPEDLLAFARARLAGYQVPERILIVDALPRTPSMKVARGEVLALAQQLHDEAI
jgi:long-chain acyl-CoA synthetase